MQKYSIKFDDYVAMVRDFAHFYTKCYGMDYADVEAQGFLIYCISLRDFNGLASFSTFLYGNLKGRLRDYCKQQQRHDKDKDSLDTSLTNETCTTFVEALADKRTSFTKEELLSYAKCLLTPDAYKVLCWVLDRQWEVDDSTESKIHAPLQSFFCDIKKWRLNRVYSAWLEIKDFWYSGLPLRGIA